MPSERSRRSIHAAPKRAGCLGSLAREESAFTIVEVVVSAVIVAAIGASVMLALTAVASTSGDQRRRSQADQLAQQDQDRMRGMSVKALNGLNQVRDLGEDGTAWSGTSTGTKFTVNSTGKFISNSGQNSCNVAGTGAAAYVLIKSTVNWQGNMKPGTDVSNVSAWTANSRRPPIIQESLITPPAGGTLLARVLDQDNAGVDAATVTIAGGESESATTDSDGCVVFGGIATGDYSVSVSKTGWVDPDGTPAASLPSRPATVTGSGTSFPTPDTFKIGQAGAITANFKTTINNGTTFYVGQGAPSISWQNPGMSASQSALASPAPSSTLTTPTKLYPFNTGTPFDYTNNYDVWAGSCNAAKPPTNLARATVRPGQTALLDDNPSSQIRLPAMVVKVTYAGSPVKPDEIELSDSCSQEWFATGTDLRATTDPSYNALGSLSFPGQPYGNYTVCADYDPPGTVTRKQGSTTVANTSFTAANTAPTIALTAASPGNACAL